jgi:glycosyltransferase involved in cell wall biosynthesis
VEGIQWFVHEVWPIVKRALPQTQLRLVGRGSEGYLTTIGPDIVGLGWLEDPGDEIASWSAMIVPIKSGSGTRVKIADGFARRCPIVTTTFGAFGYEVENGREVMMADQAEEFAFACIKLFQDSEFGQNIAQRAHELFIKRWTWDSFGDIVESVIQECLQRSSSRRMSSIPAGMSHR